MILCLGTTPAVQRVMVFRALTLDAVNRAELTLDGAAGKSINVTKVLRVLGAHPVAVGFVGGDRGEFLRSALAAKGIEHEFVAVPARTRECVTVIDQSTRAVTELVEESPPVEASAFEQLRAILRRRIPGSQAIVMSGTIAPGGPAEFYREGVRMAREAGVRSMVDAQGPALTAALEAGPDLVKPNRSELAATVGRRLDDDAAVMGAMRELRGRGAGSVVVTAGRGATLAFDGRDDWRIVGPRIAAVNPIGSGDSFLAGLVWRWLAGDDLGEACRWAAAAGAANALTPMAGEVDREVLDRLARDVTVERA